MEAIGGEVPHYVFSYAPAQELEVAEGITALSRQLAENGIKVLSIDVFDLSLKIIRDNVDLEDLYELERSEPADAFLETMQSLTDMEERFLPELERVMAEPKNENYRVLFLHSIGRAFPFLRSHNLLENLQKITKDAPTVLFFPGRYSGISFELFGMMAQDNFYRAYPIDTLQL